MALERRDEAGAGGFGVEEGFDFGAEDGIALAGLFEKDGALSWGEFDGFVEDLFDAFPVIHDCGASPWIKR